jgi:hypothetical protein
MPAEIHVCMPSFKVSCYFYSRFEVSVDVKIHFVVLWIIALYSLVSATQQIIT